MGTGVAAFAASAGFAASTSSATSAASQTSAWVAGLGLVLDPLVLLWLVVGTLAGIVFGALPGITATMGIVLMLPLTYTMSPIQAMALLLSVWSGAISGASISAILIGIPGNPNALATVNDGFPMAKKGEAGLALGGAAVASFLGGLFSTVVLVLLAPQLARVALRFGPAEYFSLGVFGLTIIASLAGRSLLKGLVAGVLGVMLSTVGMDPITAVPRFTFGNVNALAGLSLIPVLIGLFAVSQALSDAGLTAEERMPQVPDLSRLFPSLTRLRSMWRMLLESAGMGTVIGIIPGTGASIAVFLAYDRARRTSKYPERFGTGVLEGVMAPEAANNAVQGGALVPLLTLGIPGDAAAAVMLGALVVHGLRPGPMLFTEHADFVYGLFITLILANVAMAVLQLVMIRGFIQVLRVPLYILSPIVFCLALLGALAINGNMFDVGVALALGVVGYLLNKHGFPLPPLILGIILGPMVEAELRRGLTIFGGRFLPFLTRPISLAFLLLALLSVVWGPVASAVTMRRTRLRPPCAAGR